MRSTSALWATSMVLASLCGPLLTAADAAPGPYTARPKYYYPRHVKRQVITSVNETAAATEALAATTDAATTDALSSRQLDLGSLIGDLVASPPSDKPSGTPVDTPTGDSPTPSENEQAPSSSNSRSPQPLLPGLFPPTPPAGTPEAPSDVGTTGGLPETIVTPTSQPEAPTENVPSSSRGGLLESLLDPLVPNPTPSQTAVETPVETPLPSDVVTTGPIPETSVTPTEAPPASTPGLVESLLNPLLPEPTPTDVGTTGGLPETIVTPSAGPSEPAPTGQPSASPTADITVGLSTFISSDAPEETPLLPGLSSLLSEILPIPTPSGGETGPNTGVTPEPTPEPTPSGLLPPAISDIISSIESLLPSLSSGIPDASGPISSLISSLTDIIPSPTDIPITTDFPTFPSTGIEPTVTPPASDATPSSGDSSIPTPTVEPSDPSSIPTVEPSDPSSIPTPGSTAPVPTPTEETSTGGTPTPEPPTSAVLTTGRPTGPPITQNTPTATLISVTELPIQSSIFVEQSSAETGTPTATPSGIPSELPKVIQPPGGMPQAPDNSTLCQIGFEYELNYPFVVRTPDSPNQIFSFLGKGIRDGLKLPEDQVVMNAIRPYDTTGTRGFVTTLVLFYIPSDMFDKLNIDLKTPVAEIYRNDDDSVSTIMSLINPAIPLAAGDLPNASGGNNGGFGVNPSATDKPNSGGPMEGGSGSKSPVVGSSVGIAFAAIGGVAAYGAAMFFVARRYKKKRQARHQRSSSLSSTERSNSALDGYNGVTPVWMSGANGRISPGPGMDGRVSQNSDSSNDRSVRTAQISAPVMAENSLGWN